MLVANLDGRLTLVRDGLALDVERAGDGVFGSDPQAIYERWDKFTEWTPPDAFAPFDAARLGPPVPRPRGLFALALNSALPAGGAGLEPPPMPLTFTKFPSCIVGPDATVEVPSAKTDWEVELVVVIGRRAW